MGEIDRRTLIAGASLVGAVALARAARAGDLSPPAGPVTPTGRSLRDVEPRTPVSSLSGNNDFVCIIQQAGSYYFTGDMVVPQGKRGILVTAPSGTVSLDMEGFCMRGGGPGGGAAGGILVSSPGLSCLEVSDGYFRDLDGDGIDGGSCRLLDCYDLHMDRCARGIVVRTSGIIECCHVERCATDGICWQKVSPEACVFCVDECECRLCGRHGICIQGDWTVGDSTCCVSDCDCSGNTQDGLRVTVVSSGQGGACFTGTVCDCRFVSNGGFGSRNSTANQGGATGGRCAMQIEDCTCSGNGLGGMRCFAMCVDVMDCVCCDNNGDGLVMDSCRGSADGCVCSRNTGAGMRCQGACRCACCDCSCCSNGAQGMCCDAGSSGVSVTECDSQGNQVGYSMDGQHHTFLWNCACDNGQNYQLSSTVPAVIVSAGELSTNTCPHASYSM